MSDDARPGATKRKRRRKPGFARKLTRRVRYAAEVPLLNVTRWVAKRLSHRMALRAGTFVGDLIWFFGRPLRRIAEQQLLDTGVAAEARAARKIAREVFRSIGMGSFEWLHALNWPVARYKEQIRVEGIEHLEAAHADVRGAIFVSAHLGNWEITPLVYEALTQRSIGAVMAEQRNQRLNDWIVAARNKSAFTVIPRRRAAIGILRHLRSGGAVGLMGDQDSSRVRGIFVPFFGKPALTPAGPAVFARRSGVAIMVATMARDAADPTRHNFRIEPPLWPDPSLSDEEDIARLTAAYTVSLEAAIRRTPGQWVWFHRRWKHRPEEEEEKEKQS